MKVLLDTNIVLDYALERSQFAESAREIIQMAYNNNIENLCGSMKGMLSSSISFAQDKQNEIDLENKKWKQ